MQLRREVPGVQQFRIRVHGRLGVGDVVTDEPDAVGNRPLVEVRGDHPDATFLERRCQPRAATDPDLDERVESREAVDQRERGSGHAGTFMTG